MMQPATTTEPGARPPRTRAARLRAALERPVDAASVRAFRVLFGLLMFAGLVRFLASGWIPRFYAQPTFFFKYWGFEWVQPWPLWGMYLHYGVLAALALCVAAGFHHRLAALLFFLGFTWSQLVDVTNYLNHHVLVSLLALLLAVLPVARGQQTVPAWVLWALRVQVGVVYVHAGLAKLGSDWLLHAQPLNTWLTARTATPVLGPWLDELWVAYAFSWAGFLFDTTIVLWLSWRRTRAFAYVVLLGFHGLTHVFFNIGIFPFLMTVVATVFFAPDWPRRLRLRLRRQRRAPTVVTPPAAVPVEPRVAPSSRWRTAGFALLAAHLGVQVLLPLRHCLYPGDVLWNEEGMRFAWKVMLREKHGSVTYHVRLADGRELQVTPRQYLDARQEREMAGQPDLIAQLARHIARDFAARGHGPVEVRAEALVSLNGRAARLLVDPERDLAHAPEGLEASDWILPAPVSPPRQLRAELW